MTLSPACSRTALIAGATRAWAALCAEPNLPFVFPGTHASFNALTEVTNAALLARTMVWMATKRTGEKPGLQHQRRQCIPLEMALAKARSPFPAARGRSAPPQSGRLDA